MFRLSKTGGCKKVPVYMAAIREYQLRVGFRATPCAGWAQLLEALGSDLVVSVMPSDQVLLKAPGRSMDQYEAFTNGIHGEAFFKESVKTYLVPAGRIAFFPAGVQLILLSKDDKKKDKSGGFALMMPLILQETKATIPERAWPQYLTDYGEYTRKKGSQKMWKQALDLVTPFLKP